MDDKKDWTYKMGQFCGIVLMGCVLACIVTLTIKFIMWGIF